MKDALPQVSSTAEAHPDNHEPLTDQHIQDMLPNQRSGTGYPSAEELQYREEQRLEFIRIMEEKFLSGQDVCILMHKGKDESLTCMFGIRSSSITGP